MPEQSRSLSRPGMIRYSVGECANSLLMNSLLGFAMLYYTDALGLNHSLAGIAMAVAVFWDAITDPVMGHITDNTRSRFGRRHPYILLGGIAVTITFVFLWYVPDAVKGNADALFWYLVFINLLQRSAITVFLIPYMALGFELCTDYEGRVRLQGIRSAMNMLANLLGPALAWSIFFSNNEPVRATSVQENYQEMGLAFAVVALLCILFVLFATRNHIKDNRALTAKGDGLRGLARDIKDIISDFYPRYVFAFTLIATVGVALVSSLQMYLYEHFMRFGGAEKSLAHGGTMIGFATGALLGGLLTRKLEKKGAVYFGGIVSISGNVVLAALLLSGMLVPGESVLVIRWTIPITFVVFIVLQGIYWMGKGVIFPTATSMIADASEIHEIRTGINKDGAYAAIFTFSQKCAASVGILISGFLLTLIGFETGTGLLQQPDVVWKLCGVTLLVGPVISLISLGLIRFYPVNKDLLDRMRLGKDGREPGT